ncbi:MAG TPA: glycosyltransferase family 39 protein [Candidatus Acidoferrum sp.]|nr:glycosyltransferase family 39 protein [Candidatus Acidoferrum sp.]
MMWILGVAVVNPIGNFPLNDDWAWSMSVKRMLETGAFRPLGWTGMTLVTHTLWGALFCALFGFSFTVLRFSILLLGLVGVLACYWLLREARAERKFAVAGALTFGFCPVYLAMSNTFMTDVSFATMTTLSALFFLKGLRQDSFLFTLVATVLAVAATLCRQLGLFVPMAFGCSVLMSERVSWRSLLRAGTPTLITAGSLMIFEYWLRKSGRLPDSYVGQGLVLREAVREPVHFIATSVKNTVTAVLYLGLFLSPLACLMRLPPRQVRTWVNWTANAVFLAFIAGCFTWLLVNHKTMPLRGYVLVPQGIGPLTLRDTFVLHLPNVPALPGWFWCLVTVVSVLVGGLMLRRFTALLAGFYDEPGCRGLMRQRLLVFCLAGSLIYFLPLARAYADRYLLVVIPLLVCVTVPPDGEELPFMRRRYAVGILAALLAVAAFSVMTTRDYLTWNRVRWAALATLVKKDHVPLTEIDGGYEFNGWYLYDPTEKFDVPRGLWWVHNDNYLLSSGDVPGYEVLRRYEYSRLLPPGKANICVLIRRTNSVAPRVVLTGMESFAAQRRPEVTVAVSRLCE